mgnify:CR=1 FL=1
MEFKDIFKAPPRDAERHEIQSKLVQQRGISKEPVILVKTSQGYELLEGWHRTIQHFAKYPNGYTGPAYVAVAQGQQGVAKDMDEGMFDSLKQGMAKAGSVAKKVGSKALDSRLHVNSHVVRQLSAQSACKKSCFLLHLWVAISYCPSEHLCDCR